jgi:hypothetical protein
MHSHEPFGFSQTVCQGEKKVFLLCFKGEVIMGRLEDTSSSEEILPGYIRKGFLGKAVLVKRIEPSTFSSSTMW